MFQQQQNIQTQSFFLFPTTLTQISTLSCLTSSMWYIWIVNLGATDHIIENWGIMFYFTPVSNSVVLADGSRRLIQGIDTATTTLTLLLSSIFYLPCFSFNLLSIIKIIKVLNCIVIFFPTHCVFQELGTRKMTGTWRERNRLYELELASDQVTCINTSSTFDYHCWLGHPSLPVPYLLVLSLGQVHS